MKRRSVSQRSERWTLREPFAIAGLVQADTEPARAAVERLIKDVNGRTVGIRVGSGAGVIEARAGGGDVNAGQIYRVGELGEELFVPDVAGTIIPAAQTAQILNGNPGASALSTQSSGWSRSDLDYLADRIGANVLAGARAVNAYAGAAEDADARYRRI